jgi:hypothetical protein
VILPPGGKDGQMEIGLLPHAEEGFPHLKCRHWVTLLALAQNFGWEPRGTECGMFDVAGEPVHPDWGGSYTSREFQTMTAPDAVGMAGALELAALTLPDRDQVFVLEAARFLRASGGVILT